MKIKQTKIAFLSGRGSPVSPPFPSLSGLSAWNASYFDRPPALRYCTEMKWKHSRWKAVCRVANPSTEGGLCLSNMVLLLTQAPSAGWKVSRWGFPFSIWAYTTRPDKHGRVFLAPCKKCLGQCTLLYTRTLEKSLLQGTRNRRSCITGHPVCETCHKFGHPALTLSF